jgi:hypothetical protein
MSAIDDILGGYQALQAGQEAFYKDLPPLQPTLRTATAALTAAALAWLAA